MAGRAVFTNVAERISIDSWDLGEVSRLGLDASAKVRAAIFQARVGEVVGPFETPESYELYQIASVKTPEKDAQGRQVQPESRCLYRIEVAKADEPVQMTFEQAAAELVHQAQMAAIDSRVELLKTNGLNRIVWPHGRNLWGRKKGDK